MLVDRSGRFGVGGDGRVGVALGQVTGRIVGPARRGSRSPCRRWRIPAEARRRVLASPKSSRVTCRCPGISECSIPKAYIEGPTPADPSQINFANWSVLGAKALIKGTATQSGDTLSVEARLFDVAQRSQVGGEHYSGQRRPAAADGAPLCGQGDGVPHRRARALRLEDRLRIAPRRARQGDPRHVGRWLRRVDGDEQPDDQHRTVVEPGRGDGALHLLHGRQPEPLPGRRRRGVAAKDLERARAESRRPLVTGRADDRDQLGARRELGHLSSGRRGARVEASSRTVPRSTFRRHGRPMEGRSPSCPRAPARRRST